jgi:hypothetical protein
MAAEYFEETKPEAYEPGIYPATLKSIEDAIVQPFDGNDNGERWKFGWQMPDGTVLYQFTSRKIVHGKKPSNAWRVLAALGYRGGKAQRSDFIGKSCRLVLGVKESGWNSFDNFLPPATGESRPPLKLSLGMPEEPPLPR